MPFHAGDQVFTCEVSVRLSHLVARRNHDMESRITSYFGERTTPAHLKMADAPAGGGPPQLALLPIHSRLCFEIMRFSAALLSTTQVPNSIGQHAAGCCMHVDGFEAPTPVQAKWS